VLDDLQTEHRMELDSVGCDALLAVWEVEEPYAGHLNLNPYRSPTRPVRPHMHFACAPLPGFELLANLVGEACGIKGKGRTPLRAIFAVITVAAALAVAAPSAFADPTGSKNSLVFPATCNGTSYTFVHNSANGMGSGSQNQNTAPFSPVLVVGSNAVFHPTKFDLTFTFSFNGMTQSFLDTNTMRNARTPVTCTINFTQTFPDGSSLSLNGTVWGFFS
jgi:hypothetical protein